MKYATKQRPHFLTTCTHAHMQVVFTAFNATQKEDKKNKLYLFRVMQLPLTQYRFPFLSFQKEKNHKQNGKGR